MSEESDRFRLRARECRDIAARVPASDWRDRLIEIAQDLEEEARRVDSEEGRSHPALPIGK